MGHRALVAYERTDGTYNLHYSHWGASGLRLKHAITEATPYGGDIPAQWARGTHEALTAGEDIKQVKQRLDIDGNCPTDVEPLPQATDLTLEEAITNHLDFLTHEAFYVVDREFEVTAYRTLWLGLQYESRVIDQSPTVGHGIIQTVRWYRGEPVGDGYTQGQFEGMKRIVGKMIDRGVFDRTEALRFLEQQVLALAGDGTDVRVCLAEKPVRRSQR
jgi:hypothetical protein